MGEFLSKKIRLLAILLGLGTLVVSFQNCSELALRQDVIYSQSLYDSQSALDAEALPKLLNAESLSFWRKTGSADVIGPLPLMSDSASFVIAVDRGVTGVVAGLVTSTSSVEDMLVQIENGKVRAVRHTDGSNYIYAEASVPTSGDRYLIGVRFGVAKDDVALMINGVLEKSPVQKVGTPLETAFILRQLVVGSPLEAVVYIDDLLNTDLNVMSRYVANSQQVANVIFDPSLTNGGGGGSVTVPGTTTPGAEFLAAKAVIDAKCLSCHSSANNGNLTGLTQSKAISMGWVVAKNPEASKIYYRLLGSSGPGNKNMPLGGSISAAEVQAVATWINSIQ